MHMGRAARLPETPAGFDDPLEVMLGCHRRIERQLQQLRALAMRVNESGVDAEASVAAGRLLAYFELAASLHRDDEELDLYPLLAQRITDPEASSRFEGARAALDAHHRQIDAAWSRLRRPLEAIADGLRRRLDPGDLDEFAGTYATHIAAEECALREHYDRWLDDADRRALGHAMAARRRGPPSPPR